MQIELFHKNISLRNSLRAHIEDKLNEIICKYLFKNAPNATIRLSKQNHNFICDIVVNNGTGRNIIIKSNASSDDINHSFDIALTKIEKQLRKYKSKLRDYYKHKADKSISKAINYTLTPSVQKEETDEVDVNNPVIIAESPIKILPLTVGEAVMEMDLQNLPALMFENLKTGRINVVYYRKDGNISWVDSNH